MKFGQASGIRKKQAICVALMGFGFTGCATSSADLNYADGNNIDSARSRCVELARSSGYQDVAVDSVERDGQATNRANQEREKANKQKGKL